MSKMYLKNMWTLNKSFKITECMSYVKLKVKVEYECDLTVRQFRLTLLKQSLITI
jgi:hypothetical protein